MKQAICLFVFALVLSAGIAGAAEISVSKVKFSAEKIPMGGVLTISCNVDGAGQGWCTVLVYAGKKEVAEIAGKPSCARSNEIHRQLKGKPGETEAVSFRIDLARCPGEGIYTALFYGAAPTEKRIKLGEFTIDNTALPSTEKPALIENSRKPLCFLGFFFRKSTPSRFYGRDSATGRFIAPAPAEGAGVEAVFQVTNTSGEARNWRIEHLICDAFWRGDGGRTEVALAPGEKRLVYVPVTDRQAERFREVTPDEGLVRGKLYAGDNLIDTEMATCFSAVSSAPRPEAERVIPQDIPRTKTDPVWGRLTLVDAVDCAAEIPLLQGGKSLRAKYTSEPLADYGQGKLTFDWQLTYHDTTHERGFTEVSQILGKPCREADNWGWFAYLLGQGKVERGQRYLLEIEYPQDLPRMFAVLSKAGVFTPGFHTGKTLGDPWTRQRFMGVSNFPLSGKFEVWRHAIVVDDFAYRVSIHSMGDVAGPFSHGVAVRAIRLYKIETPLAEIRPPEIKYPPAPLPRRMLVHLQEDVSPYSVENMRELQIYGLNTYAPIALHYSGKGTGAANTGQVYWESKLFDRERYNLAGPGQLNKCLEAAAGIGMDILPTFEYGGTSMLPEEAFAVQPDGQKSKYYWGTTTDSAGKRILNRIDGWYCIDIAHPAVAADFGRILEEFRPMFEKYPNIKGIELTHRFASWQISFSDYELDRFAKETGTVIPQGTQPERARWVRENVLDTYYQFFYRKKREVMLAIRDKLRSIRPEMVLHVLNYVSDDHLPFGEILCRWVMEPDVQRDEFLATPGEVCLPDFNDHILSLPRQNVRLDLRELLEDYRRADKIEPGIHPPLYRQDKGIVLWAPVHYEFTAGSPTYLDFFRTGEGVSVANFWIYNEDAKNNLVWGSYGAPGLVATEHAGPFCMLEEVLTTALVDPPRIGIRAGYLKRCFPEYAQSFARAYLALPALPSEVIDSGTGDTEVVVRRIGTEKGTYYAIINRGFDLAGKELRLKCFPQGAKLTDLSSGETIVAKEGSWKIRLGPVQLRSFLFKEHE